MRHSEICVLVIDNLLNQTEQAPITISYRGVNEENNALYDIRTKGVASALLTEKELLETLAGPLAKKGGT